MRRIIAVAAVLLGSLSMAQAQMESMSGAQTDKQAGAIVEPAKALDSLLSLFEGEMMEVAKAMPAEKYNFAPSQAIFVPGQTTKFEGVRTFGQELVHMAQGNYSFYSAVSGSKPTIDVSAQQPEE